jgi:hypothetical protein
VAADVCYGFSEWRFRFLSLSQPFQPVEAQNAMPQNKYRLDGQGGGFAAR